MRYGSLLGLFALLSVVPIAARATVVGNGNFSSPSVNGSYETLSDGSTTITDWTVIGGSVDLIGSYWQAPPTGGQSVDLDGSSPGGLQQTLVTEPGSEYIVSFYLSGNPDGGDATKHLSVTVGTASELYTYVTGSNTHTDMRYTPETFTFTATGSASVLAFRSGDLSGSPWGPVLGGISVSAPEPMSVASLLAGLAGLAFCRFRRNPRNAA